MATNLQPPLVPKDGRTLKVLGIARISTQHQNELSLEDQQKIYDDFLEAHAPGRYEMKMIAGRGSGEILDRQEALEAQAELDTGEYDLVLSECLGRIFRRVHAMLFCEAAEDVGTRVITFNDHVDTAQPDWRLNAFFATVHHEISNAETSKRIRRTLRSRFQNGGIVHSAIFGYVKPPGTNTDDKLHRDLTAEPVYDHWFTMLETGATFADVADWLNGQNVSPGPSCRKKKWDGSMVGQVTRNTILKGVRVRNKTMSKRHNATGRRRSVKAPPEELLERFCEHLVFIEPQRYDRVIKMLAERNARCRRRKIDGKDPRKQVPKKRTRFPGQAVFCGVCGGLFVYGGHGRTAHLMCSGAREYHCWNGATIGEVDTRERVCEALYAALEAIPDFDETFLATLREQERQLAVEQDGALRAADAAVRQLGIELENVLAFVRQGQSSPVLAAELARLEQEKAQAERTQLDLVERRQEPLVLPDANELRELALASLKDLARDSYEFARRLRLLIPRIVVFPYRLCDSDKVVLRAKFRLRLSGLITNRKAREAAAESLDKVIEIDLFDPPQREQHRLAVAAYQKHGLNYRQAAEKLGISATAAQYAGALQRKMDELGISDPYVPVTEPPANSRKLRRHLHPRYKFTPLDDAGEL